MRFIFLFFRIALLVAIAASCSVFLSTAARAEIRYTVTDLGTLGGTYSAGYGISASGMVTGFAQTSAGEDHAFLYDGTMHDLGTLGGPSSYGYGINASGMVTGVSFNREEHAFLYDGAMRDLGTLGGTYSIGRSINASGMVTGYSYVAGVTGHAFLYDGTMHDLGLGYGNNINASGMVTGASVGRAFWYDGTMHDLGTLGGVYSEGYGINSNGMVTGYSDTVAGTFHAFLYDAIGGMVDLNTLIDPLSGWELLSAQGINDAGQIAGDGIIDGQTHAFLLTPVPEPSGFVLGAIGMACGIANMLTRKRIARV